MIYRNTYIEINLKNIKNNVQIIINNNPDYKYYFGVVKADCYGHYSNKTVKAILDGGCNYLAVSSLEEALKIRKNFKNIPILCLGIINPKYLDVCNKNNITITIPSLNYYNLIKQSCFNLKAHIKVDTGMKRLGVDKQNDLDELYNDIIKNKNIFLEGIYTHIYKAEDEKVTNSQIDKFLNLTNNINLATIPIIHITASEATIKYPKLSFVNGCRLGIVMYGLTTSTLPLKSTYKLISEVILIKDLNKGETVGYDGSYEAKCPEKIAIVPIGYADGIIRANKGRTVFINNNEYEIVGNICMDMLFVKIDNKVKIGDKVEVIKDIKHIRRIANHLNTIEYEVICNVGKRVPRIYI